MATQVRFYAALGEFVFEFSQLEFTIRHFLGMALDLGEDRFDVITSPYDFAALCKVSLQVWLTTPGLSKKELAKVKRYFNDCLELNTERNRIVHGTWFISARRAGARHVARNTLKAGFYFEELEDLKKVAQKAATLRSEMVQFTIHPPGVAQRKTEGD